MEENEFDSPLDSPASGSESIVIDGESSSMEQNSEPSSDSSTVNTNNPVSSANDSQKQTKSSSNYFNSLTWNFDTISGVLAVAFVALGTCIMYFQNSIKLGSYLLGIAILIGLFHSFVRVYLSDFKVGNRGNSSGDSEPESGDSEPIHDNSE